MFRPNNVTPPPFPLHLRGWWCRTIYLFTLTSSCMMYSTTRRLTHATFILCIEAVLTLEGLRLEAMSPTETLIVGLPQRNFIFARRKRMAVIPGMLLLRGSSTAAALHSTGSTWDTLDMDWAGSDSPAVGRGNGAALMPAGYY